VVVETVAFSLPILQQELLTLAVEQVEDMELNVLQLAVRV
tara:strand:- start:72 stop:191 length:120 start_codon:yes stop_codon:yes gene_type:complete